MKDLKLIEAISTFNNDNYDGLCKVDILNLKSYIDGWISRDSLITDEIKFNFFFQGWISSKLGFENTPFSWDKIILLCESAPLSSFKVFFYDFCESDKWQIYQESKYTPECSDDFNDQVQLINSAIKRTDSIEELIFILSKKVEMYIINCSIWNLKSFINGWVANSPNTVTDQFLLNQFEEYLNNNYFKGKNASFSYDKILAFYSLNDIDATKLFFEEFSNFTQNYNKR